MHKENLALSLMMSMLYLVSEASTQFYLALNGTDSTSCGHNISTPCRTFTWLLGVFYNESYLNNVTNVKLPGLNLITATSFEIGPQILVSCHIYRPHTYYDGKVKFSVLFFCQGTSLSHDGLESHPIMQRLNPTLHLPSLPLWRSTRPGWTRVNIRKLHCIYSKFPRN